MALRRRSPATTRNEVYKGVRWSKDDSKFVSFCNSLQIDCGRSKLIVLDVDPPALAAWGAIEAEAGGSPF
jgi:hypothetical protein